MDQSSPGALAGLRVLDLSRVLAGPFCTQILGDHGADVLKVEPPQGDETRGWGPPFADGTAAYFLGLNRNKRSVVLDLGKAPGREALLALLDTADVLIDNFKPGTLEKWGLGYEAVLATRFPRLIHCTISGFGPDGPMGGLPGYDAAIQAMAGLMSVNGEPDGPPLRMGVPAVDIATGLNAAIGILLALQERQRSDRGQRVDVALFDCGFSILHPYLANFLCSGNPPRRTGNGHPNIAPYDTFATADAPIFLAVGNDAQFLKLCTLLGKPELATDPRFRINAERSVNRVALKAELEALLATHRCDTLARELIHAGVPCGPVLGVEQAAEHPHTRHRAMVVEMEGYKGAGAPIKLGRTPATYRRRPPELGEHTDEVVKSAGPGAD